MAILIKDMEIPDSCFLCRFCRRQEYGEYYGEETAWSCVASKKRITDGQDLIATFKHPDCPLVEAAEVQDAVSRQAAIDIVDFECGKWRGLARTIAEAIEHLPSAQPKKRTDKRTETHACDCISRQAAIDAARDWYEGLICGSFKGLEKRLRALPSAQPEDRCGECDAWNQYKNYPRQPEIIHCKE